MPRAAQAVSRPYPRTGRRLHPLDPSMTITPKKPPLPTGSAGKPVHPSLPAPPPPVAPPLLTSCDLVPLGDGSYRAVPRRPTGKVTVKEAARLASYSRAHIYLLYHGGFITGERQSPRKILIDVESLQAHLEAVRDPGFWNVERRDRFWNGQGE